jgi:hypothetical protein
MARQESCGARAVLAQCARCSVEQCRACGAMHVRVGDTTLRLRPSEFLFVCATLLEAARAMPLPAPGTRLAS